MILSEGAGAVVISREGSIILDRIVPGGNFAKRQAAARLLREVYAQLELEDIALLIASANGTFIDAAEEEAILREIPKTLVYTAKPALGEGVGAGAIWQVIAASQALLTGHVPPVLRAPHNSALQIPRTRTEIDPTKHAILSTCGLNQQVAGLRLSKRL
jgi:3-oxoacyl-(acyl-carrier-protein) synthase